MIQRNALRWKLKIRWENKIGAKRQKDYVEYHLIRATQYRLFTMVNFVALPQVNHKARIKLGNSIEETQ